MRFLLRTWAVFTVALKRLLSQPWLALAAMLGLVVSIALALSIPLYADAVYYRVLREELWGGLIGEETYLPLAFMFRYIGGWEDSLQWEDVTQADAYLTDSAITTLGFPKDILVRFFRTDNFGLFSPSDKAYVRTKTPLTWVNFAFTPGIAEHITLVEGSFPSPAAMTPDAPVDVMISEELAVELGLQVGEQYVAYARRQLGETERDLEIPVRIAGVWTATDPQEAFWFYEPVKLSETLFVPEESFVNRLASSMDDEVYVALWYMVLDGTTLHANDAIPLLARIISVQQRVSSLLPNIRLDFSPSEALRSYWRSSNMLTVLLYAFSVPILGLILVFIGLVVGLSVGRQRNEIAVLRSRGAALSQVVGIAALEAILLGLVALAAGIPSGEGIAYLIGQARSFLDFANPSNLRVVPTLSTLRFGIGMAILAMLAQLAPTIGAARHTIVTYKQERARSLRPPWWQRIWLDVLLLIPAVYGAYLLRQQGSVVVPTAEGILMEDPFQNPLLFLVPALGIFALTLFILRIIPLIMSVVAWIASKLRFLGLLMAARHLARTPGFYFAPLVLLVLTLSLAAFVASLAHTLDTHLYDQQYYKVGADMRVVEQGDPTSMDAASAPFGGVTSSDSDGGPRWYFLPVSEHLKAPGVQAAARVGRYNAFVTLTSGSGLSSGTFLGVDRTDFPEVAYWRSDFAPESLGALMNALATKPNAVLVSRDFMRQYTYNIGDTFRLSVDTYGYRAVIDAEIVGAFDLFPTWYPEAEDAGPFFVGNLDYIFQEAGGQYPYNVWLKTAPDADYAVIEDSLRKLQLRVAYWNAPLVEVAQEQRRPERQGLFGVLSVGFVAAAFLTVLGFMLYAFFSFRRRFIELGVLRAVGLSAGQMTSFLAWELAFLVLVGIGAGTGFGAWVSHLFIPYLQVGAGPEARTPPFVVQIAWSDVFRIYLLFAGLFVFALLALVGLLMRMKIFQAIKLGETA